MDAARVFGSAVKWGLVLGGAGFAAGFFGPMVLTPGANQGPLLGIFITGPLGFLVGLVVGTVVGLLRRERRGRVNAMQSSNQALDPGALEREEDRWAA